MNQLAANLVDRVLPAVPVRQWVLSFPMRVRFLLARRPELRNEVLDVLLEEVTGWLGEATGRAGHGGAVSVWQLAGSALNLNPHIHAIVLDGVYAEDASGSLGFHASRRPPRRVLQRLVETVRARVMRLLVARGLTEDVDDDEEDGQLSLQAASIEGRPERDGDHARADDTERDDPRSASCEWFDLHAGPSIPAWDRTRLERLVRYVARPPLSTKRMTVREDGRVAIGFHHPWRDGTTHVLFTPQKLLERLAAIVPHPRVHLVHYHGVLAPAAAWRPRVPS